MIINTDQKFYLLLFQTIWSVNEYFTTFSLIMMNTFNIEFSSAEVWFTDQVCKALENEDNINFTLIIEYTLQI